ncbi:hypothetical protein HU200_019945 [Digitaria exilis]|uniref:RWP-RK domain-containing protein n=1 Tax=Digitaria exilis TaxID=1010633 RepID=A0A835F164_9POAL|nr:hypothetical protein HU200_019945 [Digitaria exilis]
MADGHGGEGTNDWEGPYDPLLMQDYFDDIYYLLDIPNIIDPPPPLAAQPPQTDTAGYSGDNRPSTSNNAAVDVNVTVPTPPTHIAQVAADPPCASRTQDVVVGSSACTSSATASTSAAAVAHQTALDCTGCHVLREVVHSNGLEATRLCVHGAAGVFYHAIQEVYRVNSEGLATAMTHQSYIDAKRERASNLKLADLARYFHLPMAEAATHLGVCATVLKSTSRKFHIARWPHRKIKSINTHIAKLREKGGNDGMGEMERLIEARRKIYAKLLGHL